MQQRRALPENHQENGSPSVRSPKSQIGLNQVEQLCICGRELEFAKRETVYPCHRGASQRLGRAFEKITNKKPQGHGFLRVMMSELVIKSNGADQNPELLA